MWVRSSPGTLELFMTYASCAQEFEVETDEKDLEDSQAADTNQESSLAVNLCLLQFPQLQQLNKGFTYQNHTKVGRRKAQRRFERRSLMA